jgi:hypothetical protein
MKDHQEDQQAIQGRVPMQSRGSFQRFSLGGTGLQKTRTQLKCQQEDQQYAADAMKYPNKQSDKPPGSLESSKRHYL